MPRRYLPPEPASQPEPELPPEPESDTRVYESLVGPVPLSGHDDPVGLKQRRTKDQKE